MQSIPGLTYELPDGRDWVASIEPLLQEFMDKGLTAQTVLRPVRDPEGNVLLGYVTCETPYGRFRYATSNTRVFRPEDGLEGLKGFLRTSGFPETRMSWMHLCALLRDFRQLDPRWFPYDPLDWSWRNDMQPEAYSLPTLSYEAHDAVLTFERETSEVGSLVGGGVTPVTRTKLAIRFAHDGTLTMHQWRLDVISSGGGWMPCVLDWRP